MLTVSRVDLTVRWRPPEHASLSVEVSNGLVLQRHIRQLSLAQVMLFRNLRHFCEFRLELGLWMKTL